MKVTDLVTEFAQPVVESFGCSLWDVEYVREGSERFLRLYIDKDGGIDIEDCEKIHRAMDPILDEKDPIAESYHFEVGRLHYAVALLWLVGQRRCCEPKR